MVLFPLFLEIRCSLLNCCVDRVFYADTAVKHIFNLGAGGFFGGAISGYAMPTVEIEN